MTLSDKQFPESLNARYADARYIGAGGSSQVFAARDTMLLRHVAIKILSPNATEQQVVRFQQEAKVISKLNHPNIVKVIDFGVIDEKLVYMVMDLVDGEALSALINTDDSISLADSIEIFKQICLAMSYAHAQGISHRDLKPSNVLVEDEQGKPIARVADFGLAKYTGNQFQMKTGSVVIGTPAYMSPEQYRSEEITERSDVYSFGCLMYATLSGSPPFHAETIAELALKHLNDPVPMILQTAEDVEVPPALQEVIYQCLEKRPEYRPADFSQVQERLNQIDLTKPTEKAPRPGDAPTKSHMAPYLVSPSGFGSTRGMFTNKAVVAITVLVVLVTIGICITLLDVAPNPSIFENVLHKTATTESSGLPDPASADNDTADPEQTLPPSVLEGTEAELIDRGKEMMKRKRYNLALQIFNKAVENNKSSFKAHKERSEAYEKLGKYKKALADINVAIAMRKDDKKLLQRRSDYLVKLGDSTGAIDDLTELIEEHPKSYKSYRKRAALYNVTQQFDKAMADYDRALQLQPDDESCLKERAKLLQKKGEHQKAVDDLTATIKLSPKNPNYYHLRGMSYFGLGEYQKAVDDQTRAIDLKDDQGSYFEERARAYHQLGKKDMARKDRERARKIDDFEIHFKR